MKGGGGGKWSKPDIFLLRLRYIMERNKRTLNRDGGKNKHIIRYFADKNNITKVHDERGGTFIK